MYFTFGFFALVFGFFVENIERLFLCWIHLSNTWPWRLFRIYYQYIYEALVSEPDKAIEYICWYIGQNKFKLHKN